MPVKTEIKTNPETVLLNNPILSPNPKIRLFPKIKITEKSSIIILECMDYFL